MNVTIKGKKNFKKFLFFIPSQDPRIHLDRNKINFLLKEENSLVSFPLNMKFYIFGAFL